MNNLKAKIESLLFISAKPLTVKDLAALTGCSAEEAAEAIGRLKKEKEENGGGTRIIEAGGKYQMASAPENSRLVQEFIKDETTGELSRPSLETLTIIAYRGPIAKLDLDRIRGVNCSLILRNLLLRGLIEASPDKKKREIYYTVSLDFVRFLGLGSAKELPDYERLSRDETIEQLLAAAEESENRSLAS